MSEIKTITANGLPATQDFNYLREAGFKYIQQLSGKIWTDHNLHDPGITILEVLCYALMDLGYRTGFPVNDLIREENGTINQNSFHKADKIFSTHPVTVNDYRRLLVDIPGIRNAWLFAQDENGNAWKEGVSIYAYCNQSRLLHGSQIDTEITIPEHKTHVLKDEAVVVKGLYAVKIELDEHPFYGDLNSTVVSVKFTAGTFAGAVAEIIFPHWSATDKTGKELGSLFTTTAERSTTTELVIGEKEKKEVIEKLRRSKWLTSWKVKYGNEERIIDNVVIKLYKLPEAFKGMVTGKALMDALNGRLAKEAMQRYCQRPAEIFKIFRQVRQKLLQHRNLCEDFLYNINTIDSEDLTICADIDLDVQADLETVQAGIFAAIENYLLPPVQFSTLRELLDKNIPVEEIFNGPLLTHGFLTDEALQQADLKPEFYVSDIISLLMDIPGVKNVRNFGFTVFKNGEIKPSFQTGKLVVSANHKLRLDREKCKLLYFKNSLPMEARFRESIDKLRLQQAMQNHLKYKDPDNEIPLPKGRYRNPGKHYTILNEFPMVYGLGEKNLPDEVPAERKARVKQLEGYLTFFDQLLADYLWQLENVKKMLSWNGDVKQTYFSRFFYNDTDAKEMFWQLDFLSNDYPESSLSGKSNEEKDFLKGKKGFATLQESPAVYLDRRNRLLDHLAARFAESFSDYAVYMYNLPDEKTINDEEVAAKLIVDKLQFLQNYPLLSSQRSKAYDYSLTEDPVMESKELSGFARRMCSLLGMEFKGDLKLSAIPKDKDDEYGGFHLVEHILLRPSKDKDPLLGVCIKEDCLHCGNEDPYSFKASVILPFWVSRFKNMNFRNYVETLFRMEAPSHVQLKICWIDQKEMEEFEKAFAAWKKEKAAYTAALPAPPAAIQKKYSDALAKLITVMEDLRTDFPEATLHDCSDRGDENDNRVFLGHTALGTFNTDPDE